MNQFLDPDSDPEYPIPSVAYARFDQSEPVDLVETGEAVFVFSAVSADWMRQQSWLRHLLPRQLARVRDRLHRHWQRLFTQHAPNKVVANFFEHMQLLRYEITLSTDQEAFDAFREYAAHEESWYEIHRCCDGGIPADVYRNLFGEPESVSVEIKRASTNTAALLTTMFDMGTWPDAQKKDLADAIERVDEKAVALAAFDVGQGSATALLDENQWPILFHDLGAGVTRNTRTTPPCLKFCWRNDPTIVLSHWDSDHWAGALRDNRALSQTWIAPRQLIGPTHTAFANKILTAGGRLLIWGSTIGPLTHSNATGQRISLGRCTGSGRNGTCLAMLVENDGTEGNPLKWLATGDAGYNQVPFTLPNFVAAAVVPHHGARMPATSVPPHPRADYARLLFSFGPGNSHGPTSIRHPTESAVEVHEKRAWDPGTWAHCTNPADTVAGGHILATSQHPMDHLGGVAAGWTANPLVSCWACCGCRGGCTATITQG